MKWAAGIAHEINQPLTAISMYAKSGLNFLKKNNPKLDRLEDALLKLSEQAHRAGSVLERMQEMTKPRDSHQEITDCDILLKNIHRLAEVEAQIRDFIIILRLDSNSQKVNCDTIQIQQVILNLLRNGMEAMDSNKKPKKIILQSSYSNHGVKISIIDTGHGYFKTIRKAAL